MFLKKWMLQKRNENGQMPKDNPGTFCFFCKWHYHRDVLLQPICNLCTAAWYFLISNFNKTSVCNLNLSCSLGARERDYLTVILCYSWMDVSGIQEKTLPDGIPIGNYLLPVQIISTSRHACRITYMNTCSAWYYFVKCGKFVYRVHVLSTL